ncbi:MAG: ribbon-helix-helix domain-containing protein [Patescibacteria group bacterium]
MRNIINISLPEEMAKAVEREVKKGQFASTSEYFRHLLRTHELAEELEKSRREFEFGKGKILRSLKDLR